MHRLQQNDKFSDLKKQYLLTFGKVKKIAGNIPTILTRGKSPTHPTQMSGKPPFNSDDSISIKGLLHGTALFSHDNLSQDLNEQKPTKYLTHQKSDPLQQVSKHGWQQWHQDRDSGQQDGADVQVKTVTVMSKSKYYKPIIYGIR